MTLSAMLLDAAHWGVPSLCFPASFRDSRARIINQVSPSSWLLWQGTYSERENEGKRERERERDAYPLPHLPLLLPLPLSSPPRSPLREEGVRRKKRKRRKRLKGRRKEEEGTFSIAIYGDLPSLGQIQWPWLARLRSGIPVMNEPLKNI